MFILSVDTSADETSAAITNKRKILSNVIYSQINLHKYWGGIMPTIAKRAHKERIDGVINRAIKKSGLKIKDINYLAVTYGPGLAIALEVGINKIKQFSIEHNKKVIPVNHLEGHLYSCFGQNRMGHPDISIKFPYLGLILSGGHTEFVIIKKHINYQLIGETIDDALGEALDKGARLLTGAGYPGGPVIERLAQKGNDKFHYFPRPMMRSDDLNFSFSGLKTSLVYYLKKIPITSRQNHLPDIAASYQKAAFDSIIIKLDKAMKKTGIKSVLVGGGVIANQLLKQQIKKTVKKNEGVVLFPKYKSLIGDNAAMIGIVAYYKAKNNNFITDINKLDRIPRAQL